VKQQLNLETGEITRPKMLENDAFAIFWLWNHWMSEWVNEWVNEWVSEWVSEWMSEWVNEWVNEWMNEWKASKSVFGLMTLTFDFRTPIIDNFIFFPWTTCANWHQIGFFVFKNSVQKFGNRWMDNPRTHWLCLPVWPGWGIKALLPFHLFSVDA